MLDGKRLLVTGLVTTDSIAFATAQRAQELGAELLLTALDRDRERCLEAAAQLSGMPQVVSLDVTKSEDFDRLATVARAEFGRLDGALHAVAFAPRDALAGDFLAASAESAELAFRTSAFSYASLARVLADLAPPQGAALVGLDFDAAGAWPVYNWMGVSKAALESVNRYLARDLGPRGIRANLVAAGPLRTRAAGGIPDFQRLLDAWDTQAPIPWDPADAGPVADATCFLLSDLARAITGEILHVDGGYHAMAGALRAPARDASEVGEPVAAAT
ncbi:MAG: enoyl-ACP reductase FabI [Solirubrobacteraceae bacterium]|nr:enoyl-ACP reductase FabI [Solirubrobacteraceae bacterium]